MDATSAAFAVPLLVLVVSDRDGVQHHGTLQLPRRVPASPGRPPSSADLARLRPLMSALGDALAAQEEGLDPERLSRTYAALMAELQEAAGMGVHAVELTPATLAPVLPEGQQGDEEGEDEDEEGEEGDERRNAQLAELPKGLRALAGEVRELTVRSTRLAVVPVWVGELTRLEALEISGVGDDEGNTLLKSLPASLGQLGALKQLTLAWLDGLEVLPDAVVRLTSLGSLTIEGCNKLKTLPRGLGKLGALTQLTLQGLHELQEMPDLIGLTALGSLKLECGSKLRALPGGLGELPCIEALTALHELCLDVADYAQGSRAFTALSRSLPCLQQLQVLLLRASDADQGYVALQARDVLAIGRALKAWPLPLLRVVEVCVCDYEELSEVEHADAEESVRLSTCWRALGLPAAAAGWTNTMTLDYLRVQQQKVAAFASGMHARLGAASGVSWLDEQALVMIADEVLGGWGLLKEWRQELVAANV
jgi:hypothetical protein